MVVDKLEEETLEPKDVIDSFIDDTDPDEEEEPHRLMLYKPYMELNLQQRQYPISKSSQTYRKLFSDSVKKQWTRQTLHQVTPGHRQPSEPEDDMMYSDEDDGYSENDMIDASAEGNIYGFT